MNATFIGGGNMATALIGGLVAGGASPRDFRIVEPLAAQQGRLAGRFPGVGIFGDANAGAITGADLVVLAVKPQHMRMAAQAIAAYVADVSVVMTIAAGTRIGDLSRWLGGYSRIVRAMPNTPALVGAGISGAYAPPAVDAAGRALATLVLEAAGEVLWVDAEEKLDAVTGVSGSGPAYAFYFLEGLEQAGLDLGFAPADARKLAYSTFAGAIKLAQASEESPGTLRAQVTSKGGTTERGIATLDEGAVRATLVKAVKAAAARATGSVTTSGKTPDVGQQIVKYLLDVVFGLITYALLLRFVMQAMRAPFRNPVGQAVIALTDWIVKPLRRVLPGFKGLDWASLVATIVFQFLWLLAYALVFGSFSFEGVGIPFLLLATLIALVRAVLWLIVIVVLVQAVLSWVAPDGPLSGLLNALTFPLLRPIRRVIPPIGGSLDLSPLVVIVIAQLLLMMLPYFEGQLTGTFLGLGAR